LESDSLTVRCVNCRTAEGWARPAALVLDPGPSAAADAQFTVVAEFINRGSGTVRRMTRHPPSIPDEL
jgi:hypothetical protein